MGRPALVSRSNSLPARWLRGSPSRKDRPKAYRRLAAEPLENRDLLATLIELGSLPADQGFVLNSVVPQDRTALSVSSAGDIDGDGFDDLLIGAPVDRFFPAGTGQTYVVYGKGDSFGTGLDLWDMSAEDGFTLFGIDPEDHFGVSTSGAGDINGDGRHDIIVGAPFAERDLDNGVVPDAGHGYVFFGGFEFPPGTSELDGGNGFLIQGVNPFDQLGLSVSSAGDVNGDGFDDVILGAPGDPTLTGGSGTSYLVYGSADPFPDLLNVFELDGSNGVVFNGVHAADFAGFSVSGIGDLNGDGFDDFAIGAPGADRNAGSSTLVGSGETYVVFGGFDQPPNLSQLDGTNGFTLHGLQAYDRSGLTVSSAGDINGDGLDDMLIGAPADLQVPVGAGKGYVVFGTDSGFAANLNLWELDGSDGFILQGIDSADHNGFSISGAGDVNGDGFDDLLLGAPWADRGLSYSTGESHLVFGRPSGFPDRLFLGNLAADEGLLLRGGTPYDLSGYSVSAAGDINGDGFDDFVIGAPVDLYNSFRPGRGYVVFGRDFTNLSPLEGDSLDNTLNGDEHANSLIAGQGDDTLNGAGGADVLRGGQGNDLLTVPDLGFRMLDGGRGHDTLSLGGPGLSLDLSAIPDNRLTGIEEIDLTGGGDHTLVLGDVREVLRLSDTSNQLIIHRDFGDTVDLGAGWTEDLPRVIDGQHYRVFRQGAAEVLVNNLPPSVDLNGPSGTGTGSLATYFEDQPPVAIVAPDLAVLDDDLIVSSTVTLADVPDGSHESLRVAVGDSGIQASYDPATGRLELSGAAAAETYAQVLRTLSYINSSQHPDTADRLVSVVVNDGLVDSSPAVATVEVVAINDAPILDDSQFPSLTAIPEDTTNPSGDTVAAVVIDGSIADVDGMVVEAIAVVGAAVAHGSWQYSLGGTWMDLDSVTPEASRLLGPADRIRFVPRANFNGTALLTFRAWDQSSGTAGGTADTTLHGGTTPFSSQIDTASVRITPVNDAPLLDTGPDPALATIKKNERNSSGDQVAEIVVDGSISDVDGAALQAIAIVEVDESNGHWEHSSNRVSWSRVSASPTASLLLGPGRWLRFVPAPGFVGSALFSFRAWDISPGSGFDGGTADTTRNGGTTAFSTAIDVATVEVREIDADPTLDFIATPIILPAGTTSHSIDLTGISNGGDAGETIVVTATSNNPSVLPHPIVGYASPGDTGTVNLAPVADASGWATVTVTVGELDGDQVSRSFSVSVGDNTSVWQNPVNPLDVTNDTVVAPVDVVAIINELNNPRFINEVGILPLPPPAGGPPPFLDVSGDGFAVPRDALIIINFLNSLQARGEGEGEAGQGTRPVPAGLLGRVTHSAAPRAAGPPVSGASSEMPNLFSAVKSGSAQSPSPAAVDRLFARGADRGKRLQQDFSERESIWEQFDDTLLAGW